MATTPTRPDEISEEEKAILRERLKTVEEDAKQAVDARQAVAEIRKKLLQHPAPR